MDITPDHFARALADPTRLRILVLLADRPELCVCELTEALALAQPKISRHLAVLREAGVLLDRRAGQWIHYRLHPDLPDWVLEAIRALARGCAGRPPYQEDAVRITQPRAPVAGICG